jgi:hypothetical protein
MTALAAVARFTVDTFVLAGLIFIALVVYTLYTSDPTIVNSIYCHANTDGNAAYKACLIMHN